MIYEFVSESCERNWSVVPSLEQYGAFENELVLYWKATATDDTYLKRVSCVSWNVDKSLVNIKNSFYTSLPEHDIQQEQLDLKHLDSLFALNVSDPDGCF